MPPPSGSLPLQCSSPRSQVWGGGQKSQCGRGENFPSAPWEAGGRCADRQRTGGWSRVGGDEAWGTLSLAGCLCLRLLVLRRVPLAHLVPRPSARGDAYASPAAGRRAACRRTPDQLPRRWHGRAFKTWVPPAARPLLPPGPQGGGSVGPEVGGGGRGGLLWLQECFYR